MISGGELYVLGRTDDVVILGGRNYSLADIEDEVAEQLGLSRGRVQAASVHDGYVIAVEEKEADSATVPIRLARVRTVAVRCTGRAPTNVILVRPGTLPRTPSGKPKRSMLVRHLSERAETDVVATFEGLFSGTRIAETE